MLRESQLANHLAPALHLFCSFHLGIQGQEQEWWFSPWHTLAHSGMWEAMSSLWDTVPTLRTQGELGRSQREAQG